MPLPVGVGANFCSILNRLILFANSINHFVLDFYFRELSEYGKDKQLFTNKTSEREKISTLKGKENIQF